MWVCLFSLVWWRNKPASATDRERDKHTTCNWNNKKVLLSSAPVLIILIYLPPKSLQNILSDFTELLILPFTICSKILVGDQDVCMDSPHWPVTVGFMSILKYLILNQYTHTHTGTNTGYHLYSWLRHDSSVCFCPERVWSQIHWIYTRCSWTETLHESSHTAFHHKFTSISTFSPGNALDLTSFLLHFLLLT